MTFGCKNWERNVENMKKCCGDLSNVSVWIWCQKKVFIRSEEKREKASEQRAAVKWDKLQRKSFSMTREEKRIYCCFYSGSCDVMRARCRYEVTQVTDFTRTADDFMKPSTQREKDIKEQFGSFFVGFVFSVTFGCRNGKQADPSVVWGAKTKIHINKKTRMTDD